MAYADTYNTAKDEAIFQPRCFIAMWTLAQDVIGNQGLSQSHRDWAALVLRGQQRITGLQLALQVLRDPTVLAGLNNATDPQILTATISRLDNLVQIG